MLTKTKKAKVIKEVAVHATDTGSTEVQVAVLSKRIDELASHLKKNPKATDSEIRMALDGLKCRCGTHVSIMRAIKRAQTQMS